MGPRFKKFGDEMQCSFYDFLNVRDIGVKLAVLLHLSVKNNRKMSTDLTRNIKIFVQK
ncbi:hypothetical protein CDL12_08653 [Handroanthus impetiginosus]|uniref:Uncharacterized protein n=1 Tax=Handroanthus impetiginosus TaxID=429701 RepID=A0A2G9HMB9_9LAMI|nr:hypothetical protein CDL12_08653 [Handroanthus impetiginosus]